MVSNNINYKNHKCSGEFWDSKNVNLHTPRAAAQNHSDIDIHSKEPKC